MEYIRLQIKRRTPFLYGVIRKVLFPLHQKHTAQRRQSFTEKTVAEISRFGQNFKIVLDPQNGFVDTEIFTNGIYEPDILKLIQEYLKPGQVFIDIGANIGQHSLFATSVVGRAGKVYAFEPIPRLVSQLRESILLNAYESYCTVLPYACSDEDGTATLKLRPGNIGGSSINHTNTEYESIDITVKTADSCLSELTHVDLIKIDTEGFEVKALLGLEKTLAKHHPKIIVEYSPSLTAGSQTAYADEFFDTLNKHSYRYFDIEEGFKEIHDTKAWSAGFTKTQTNLLCTTKTS